MFFLKTALGLHWGEKQDQEYTKLINNKNKIVYSFPHLPLCLPFRKFERLGKTEYAGPCDPTLRSPLRMGRPQFL